jgi:hypothetical protein
VESPQLSIQPTSAIQHCRPSSHLANEYIPHLPHQRQQQGTGMAGEPTLKILYVYGYHPSFLSLFSPAVYAVPTPVPLRCLPHSTWPPHWHRSATSLQDPYKTQPSPRPYAWYSVPAIGRTNLIALRLLRIKFREDGIDSIGFRKLPYDPIRMCIVLKNRS